MESRIMDLYRHLDHNFFQYDFYVESGQPGMFDEEVHSLGGRVHKSTGNNRHNIPDFKAFRRFLLIHPEYRIVYAYNQWAGWYLKEAKKCGVPYRIANSRTSIEINNMKNLIKKLTKLNVNKYATQRFAVSKKAAKWLFGEKAVKAGLVKVWPNAIDTEKFKFSEDVRREVRKELGLGNCFTVLHVGNIRYEKNHPFLLRVFAELKKSHVNAKLVLVGGGDIESLKSQMQKLDIANDVKYLGVRRDIPRVLQAGDVFIFPSFYEGFPGAVLEAEASGLNCIVSDSITDEIMLTNHIRMMPLAEGPSKWANVVNEFKSFEKSEAWLQIKRTGYDIEDLVKSMEEFFALLFEEEDHGNEKII